MAAQLIVFGACITAAALALSAHEPEQPPIPYKLKTRVNATHVPQPSDDTNRDVELTELESPVARSYGLPKDDGATPVADKIAEKTNGFNAAVKNESTTRHPEYKPVYKHEHKVEFKTDYKRELLLLAGKTDLKRFYKHAPSYL